MTPAGDENHPFAHAFSGKFLPFIQNRRKIVNGFFKTCLKVYERFPIKLFVAREMSGCLCFGSSDGSGLKTIFELEPVRSIIRWANSSMVVSAGFPMFIGPR